MTVIYTITLGSFIGYSAPFPLAIKVIFGFQHVVGPDGALTHDTINHAGPSALTYAWMGPFIGALIRPIGRGIADRAGGPRFTQIVSVVVVASALGVAYYMAVAYRSPTPEAFSWPFFILFIVLFTATGDGNGSTFRGIAVIADEEQAGSRAGVDFGGRRLRCFHYQGFSASRSRQPHPSTRSTASPSSTSAAWC